MTHKELKEKIGKIVQDAVESQMDWDKFYSGENEKATEEILEVFYKHQEEQLEEKEQ